MTLELRARLRERLGLKKESWSEAGDLAPFLCRLMDHEFGFSTQEMNEDSATFFDLLFPSQPGLVDQAGIMLDYDRCVMWVLNLEKVSRPTKVPARIRYFSLSTRTYIWRVFSVRKCHGEVIVSCEKFDIREPFARQLLFDIVCPNDDHVWNLIATSIDQCITSRTEMNHTVVTTTSSDIRENSLFLLRPLEVSGKESGRFERQFLEIDDTDEEAVRADLETTTKEAIHRSAWQ